MSDAFLAYFSLRALTTGPPISTDSNKPIFLAKSLLPAYTLYKTTTLHLVWGGKKKTGLKEANTSMSSDSLF